MFHSRPIQIGSLYFHMLGRIDALMVINVTWQVVSGIFFKIQVRLRMRLARIYVGFLVGNAWPPAYVAWQEGTSRDIFC